MDLAARCCVNLQSTSRRGFILTGSSPLLDAASRKTSRSTVRFYLLSVKPRPLVKKTSFRVSARVSTATVETETNTSSSREDIEALLAESSAADDDNNRGRTRKNKQPSGASSVSSGVRLENITKSYKGATVLKEISWEVKKGEKVGLVGVNGAGKTTQLRIITGQEEPDGGNVIKAKPNMRISFLSQEFEVSLTRTVKEEFMSAFKEEMEVAGVGGNYADFL